MDQPPKLRIMCSYGGHIIPRPRTKSLCYAGGETRVVSLNTTAVANLSSLVSHLSSSLSIPSPFVLKYQLPNHDLDSLISLLTDEDLLILIDELQSLSSSSGSSSSSPRIRLFVFPAKASLAAAEDEEEEPKRAPPPSSLGVMQHPKTEAWFFDALNSAKIMQKGRNCGGGLGFESEVNGGGEDLAGNGIGLSSAAESMVLETSSSFGSTSSSASQTNLAPLKSNVDDTGIGLQDTVAKLTPSDTISSEYGGSTVTSCPQTGAYHDHYNPIHVASTDDRVCPNPAKLEIKGSDISSGVQVHNTVMASPYQLDPNPIQHQQVQYIQVESPYMAHNSPGFVPISSFYPLYHTQMPQQQSVQFQYHPNQPQPVYLFPVPPTQTYSFPGYHGFAENSALTSSQTPHHINTSYITPQVVQTQPTQTDTLPNLASQVHNTAHSGIPRAAAPILHVPYTESHQQQQPLGLYEKPHQTQPIELHDDTNRVQVYKSQPPPPPVPSQYQTVAKATEVLLSEALDQLHTDSLKHQIKTSQPQ